MTGIRHLAAGLVLAMGLVGAGGSAAALRPAQDRVAPLCRDVATGERCQTRSGDVRVRGSGRTVSPPAPGSRARTGTGQEAAADSRRRGPANARPQAAPDRAPD